MGLAEFTALRDRAVMIGMLSRSVSIEDAEQWIAQCDRALGVGPILDPTLYIKTADELQKQIRFMRAFLAFRREVEAVALGDDVQEPSHA